MNSGDPQGSGCGALIVGHIEKRPVAGLLEQGPLPPAQFLNPLEMSLTPMSKTVGPVTIGGKIRFKILGDIKESPISRRAHKQQVPNAMSIFLQWLREYISYQVEHHSL